MPKGYVWWTQEGNIAVVTINNPPLNVLNTKVVMALQECLSAIRETKDCRAMVLTGEGRAFVAGADIKEIAELLNLSVSTLDFTGKVHATLDYLENFPIPTIAAINGLALGGGLELALTFDLRIAAETVLLGVPEVQLGLFPGFGGTQRLPRLVGVSRAKEMLFSGKPITAAESLRIGLVNKVVPPDRVLSASKEMAHYFASRSGRALQLLKEAVDRGIKMSLEEGCGVERNLLDKVFQTRDAREGVSAFIEKRKACFKHC